VFGVQGDVRSYESVAKVVEAATARFGRLDILVNNAAGNFLCPAKDLTPNGFKTGAHSPYGLHLNKAKETLCRVRGVPGTDSGEMPRSDRHRPRGHFQRVQVRACMCCV
jgi:NAD(P)-dependent dehydrogenase (short-subunit alcohol dehydrogenase family)